MYLMRIIILAKFVQQITKIHQMSIKNSSKIYVFNTWGFGTPYIYEIVGEFLVVSHLFLG